MEKKQALNIINGLIDQVIQAGSFKGRAKLLTSLNGFYDLINDHKPSKGFYEYIIKESILLVENRREILSAGLKGG